MNMKSVLLLGFVMLSFSASAQIGMSQRECQMEFGGDVNSACPVYGRIKWEKMEFYKIPYMMSVYFLDHKAAAVIYKLDRQFTNEELDFILRRNGFQAIIPASPLPALPIVQAAPLPSEEVIKTTTQGGIYKVKKGDSLSVIAHKHHIGTNALAKFNNLDVKKPLKVGQAIRIPMVRKTETITNTMVIEPMDAVISPSMVVGTSWSIPGINAYTNADRTSLTVITDVAREYLAQQETTKTEEEKLPPRDELEAQFFGK